MAQVAPAAMPESSRDRWKRFGTRLLVAVIVLILLWAAFALLSKLVS